MSLFMLVINENNIKMFELSEIQILFILMFLWFLIEINQSFLFMYIDEY
jgi:hypothetical protein